MGTPGYFTAQLKTPPVIPRQIVDWKIVDRFENL